MSFPTVGILDNFNAYSAGALPSPWAIAFGDANAMQSDGAGHANPLSNSSYCASYHTTLGSLTNTECYCTLTTLPTHLSSDGIFLTVRSQKVSGGGAPTGSQNGYTMNILGDGSSGWVWNLGKIGSPNLINNTSIALSAGDKIGISAIGTTITAWYCPVSTGVWQALGSATDSAFTSGWVGVEALCTTGQTAVHFDDLGAGAPIGMVLTNQTTQDLWFGPLHLAGGVGNTLSVDDTSAVSLYRKSDDVADSINFAYASGKVTVSGASAPFPRPTGAPTVTHGDGSPEGVAYASEGTLYLRRDTAQIYQKATLKNVCTGWTQLGRVGYDQIKRLGLGYKGECWPRDAQKDNITPTTGDFYASAIALAAGDVVTNVLVNVTGAFTTPTLFKVGLFDASGNLLASSANSTGSSTSTGMKTIALSASYTASADGLFYLGVVAAATTMGSLGGSNGNSGRENPITGTVSGAYKKTGQSDIPTTLGTTQTDTTVWLGWN